MRLHVALCSLILAFAVGFAAAQADVRLAGKTTTPEGYIQGRLEVLPKGQKSWSSVCDSKFDDADASVACRQLGYATGFARTGAAAGQGPATQAIRASGFQCVGTEARLLACKYQSTGITCTHSNDAGVACVPKGYGCSMCMTASSTGRGDHASPVTKAQCEQLSSALSNSWASSLAHNWDQDFKCSSFSGSDAPTVKMCSLISSSFNPDELADQSSGIMDQFEQQSEKSLASTLADLVDVALEGIVSNSDHAFTLEYSCPNGAYDELTRTATSSNGRPMPPKPCNICLTSYVYGRGDGTYFAQCERYAYAVTDWANTIPQNWNVEFKCMGVSSGDFDKDPATLKLCSVMPSSSQGLSNEEQADFILTQWKQRADITSPLYNMLFGTLEEDVGTQQTFQLEYACPNGAAWSDSRSVGTNKPATPHSCDMCLTASATGRTEGGSVTQEQCDSFASAAFNGWANMIPHNWDAEFTCTSFSGSDAPVLKLCSVVASSSQGLSNEQQSDFILGEWKRRADSDVPSLATMLGRALGGDAGTHRTFELDYACPSGAAASDTRVVEATQQPAAAPKPCDICMTASATGRQGGSLVTTSQCDALARSVSDTWASQIAHNWDKDFACDSFSGTTSPTIKVCSIVASSSQGLSNEAQSQYILDEFSRRSASDVPKLSSMLQSALGGPASTQQEFMLEYSCPGGASNAATLESP